MLLLGWLWLLEWLRLFDEALEYREEGVMLSMRGRLWEDGGSGTTGVVEG